MITRRCGHCAAEIEILDEARASCPVCGLDPEVPSAEFDDGPAFFFGYDSEPVVSAQP